MPAYHSPPPRIMCGTLAKVSALLITVGPPHSPTTAGKGGRIRGMPRLPSSDSISAGAAVPVNIEIAPAAENIFPDEALRIRIADRLLHNDRQIPVFAAN